MKTMRTLACALALMAAAAPAMAADLIFRADGNPEILSEFDGRPFWEMQAYCAGVHGATANWLSKKGRVDQSERAEAAGTAAFGDALRQLQRDRNIDAAAATRLIEPMVQLGGRKTAAALNDSGTDPMGKWNYWRSFCIDAKAAYVRAGG